MIKKILLAIILITVVLFVVIVGYNIMSAEQIKKPAISTVGGLFDLFKVQGFFGISPKNLALGEQTLCSPSRHSNERAHQNR